MALRKVDFLRGDEPFKLRLTNAEINLNSYFGARTRFGRAALAAHRWRARLRSEGRRGRIQADVPDSSAPGVPHLSSGN